jgi:phosphonopyruvate decarboxylase
MIQARDFIDAARQFGFQWYAGVPCSFLTPFINYVLQDAHLHYLSMANEGDAVAFNAGVALGGEGRGVTMMQNSGLGNAVSPLTSLTWTFRLPQLLIVTWRGQPGISDEPQHALMGPITPQLLETMEIPWELFPTEARDIGAVLERAVAHMDREQRPYALLMQKGSVAAHALQRQAAPPASPRAAPRQAEPTVAKVTRQAALRAVVERTGENTAVLASTGFCGRELYAIADRANYLYMVGSMGCVVPLALGLALTRPDLDVLALDGDGAALMRMGAFATVGAYAPKNLSHLLLDNGVHDSTGGQATVSASVDFAAIAAACGYADATQFMTLPGLNAWLGERRSGARFARFLIVPGSTDNLPRPAVTPAQVKNRFMQHFHVGTR